MYRAMKDGGWFDESMRPVIKLDDKGYLESWTYCPQIPEFVDLFSEGDWYDFCDLGGNYRISRQEILETYFPYWSKKMREKDIDEDQITHSNCIEDWIVVHWASKVKENKKDV